MTDAAAPIPTLDDVRRAAARIHGHVHRTPVLTSRSLDQMAGAHLFFKCENLQRVGAFKLRGATNAVLSLGDEEAARGVATHSSGNHAAALALAARNRGVPAFVVMPRTAPAVKRAAVAGYGARIVTCEPTLAARESTLAEVVRDTGAAVVHPYNDPRVIAGQGTAALELLEEVPRLDVVMTPVGGGGLLSGTAITGRGWSPGVRVIGTEPAGADDACRSLAAGRILPSVNPQTVCDGLLTSLGELTFAVIRTHVERIVTVGDDAIVRAMRHVLERMKIVIEPSSAVPVAVALEHAVDLRELRVGIVLSGGNVDLDRLPWQPAPGAC
jgi:threonine dehydratase